MIGEKTTIKRKLNSKKGFTIGEVLVAMIIMLLVSATVASGIPAAREAYEKVVLASNAEVLLSTTISNIRNELGASKDAKEDTVRSGDEAVSGTIISYYNLTRGTTSRIYLSSDGNEGIMLQRYYSADKSGLEDEATKIAVLKKDFYAEDLYVTYTSAGYSDGIVTFNGLSVNSASGRTGLATRDHLSVRVVSD